MEMYIVPSKLSNELLISWALAFISPNLLPNSRVTRCVAWEGGDRRLLTIS